MQFKLTLKQSRQPGRVKQSYSVLIGLLVIGFIVVFASLSIIGGVLAAMFYAPVFLGIAVVVLLLAILGKNGSQGARQEILLDEQGISAPFPPFRHRVTWDGIRSVQLRFGVLTVTFRDGASHQYPVAPPAFDAGELELFAAAQMLQAKR